jgi:shikimate dehydrogenase
VTKSQSVDAYAVIGNPVAHSLSPQIHRRFAEQTGQSISYEAIEVAENALEPKLDELRQAGYRGLNVTVPFKQRVWQLCDQRSPRADDAGAVNTLIFMPDGNLAGDNTDGVGLTRDLTENLGISIRQSKVLVLGAGGAVRGVLGPVLAQQPDLLTIANRTVDKAVTLAEDFRKLGEITVSSYNELGTIKFDLIINGTSAGLNEQVPPIPEGVLGVNSICYDMVYSRSGKTAFVDWALSRGAARAYDGLGMLVEQAAESFRIWRGVEARTAEVIQSLRTE